MKNTTKKTENIKLLLSMTDLEKSFFTGHQLELVKFLQSGLSIPEIAQKWGCGLVNVYNRISCCAKKLEKLRLPPGNGFGMPQNIRVSCHILCSMTGPEESSFTEHQLELVSFIQFGLSIPEIAQNWGCGVSAVYSQIYNCAKKLENLRLPPGNDPSSAGKLHKKISFLCSMAEPEKPSFTVHQLDLVNSLQSGLSVLEIAQKWGCGVSAVYTQISYCAEKLEKLRLPPGNDPSNARKLHKKISFLCSMAEPEKPSFTVHQLDLVNSLRSGLSVPEIAQKWGCGSSTVHSQIYYCAKKLEDARLFPAAKSRRNINYGDYSGLDFSVLSTRERECLQSRIDHPDHSNSELAEMLDLSYSKFSTALFNAIRKLEGKDAYYKSYQQAHRDSVNAASKRYKDKNKEKYKAYRKQWWEKNRDDILAARKIKRKKQKEKKGDS